MDRQTRELERRVKSGDFTAVPALARIYERLGENMKTSAYVVHYVIAYEQNVSIVGVAFTLEGARDLAATLITEENYFTPKAVRPALLRKYLKTKSETDFDKLLTEFNENAPGTLDITVVEIT